MMAVSLAQMMSTAERELGAFLLAVSEIAGTEQVEEAGALWIQMLEEADQFNDNPQHIFRQTTIKALAELSVDTESRLLAAS
jgi:hypothetical protein